MSRKTELPLGAVIRALRVRKGWTQAELGERAGVLQSQIAHLECGRNLPSLAMLTQIADALQVPIWKMMRWAEKIRELHT